MSTIDEMCEWFSEEVEGYEIVPVTETIEDEDGELTVVDTGKKQRVVSDSNPETKYYKREDLTDDEIERLQETNVQLTKSKVSDIIGDKTVSGVFSHWDEDSSDMILAENGDFVIRVTGPVQKGDLLESNGDGTAKVQDDDIVRSSTIGKAMYSFKEARPNEENLVPCLLMLA
jgi:hypothetical protein